MEREFTSMDMEPESSRIVDMTALHLLANCKPKIPDISLTTLADTVEKECREFYHAIHANGIKHARISIDRRKSSGKIDEVLPKKEQEYRFMAVVGLLTLNMYPYLDAENLANWYGLGNKNHMTSIVPELCRGDGHFKFERGKETTRELIKRFNNN